MKILSLQAAREVRDARKDDQAYKFLIIQMNKAELLEEMIRFQGERSANGELTLNMMLRGKVLFKALEERAETKELKLLARSYRRHLEYEIDEYVKRA